ncbi:MAG: aspartyl protease family protein [Chloroflexota bacterium]|nr:aspartyl protease family protein [Chloroflexota bacterium]
MGHIREKARLYSHGSLLEETALVDTGSTSVILPKDAAEKLGVQAQGKMEVELANGEVHKVDYGVIEVEIAGRRAPVIAAIVKGGEVCVGVEALERLGLAVDPTDGRIYPTRRFVTRL